MQRSVLHDALQIRGPSLATKSLGPGSAEQREERCAASGTPAVIRANHFMKNRSDLPTCQVPFLKYSAFQKCQITLKRFPSCPDKRGVARTCRTRGGMRWTRAASLTKKAACGRQSRGGLAPRRWCLVYGKQFPWARVANKPGTPRRPRRSC